MYQGKLSVFPATGVCFWGELVREVLKGRTCKLVIKLFKYTGTGVGREDVYVTLPLLISVGEEGKR